MKNTIFRRGTALLASLALAASLALTPALAYGAGTELHKSTTTISDDLRFVNTVSTHSNGRQESFALEYTPTRQVSPVVWSGNTLVGKTDILQGADALSAQGYYVLGGINADFFSTSTGVPMGLTIQDGRLVSSDDGRPAVAFRPDGSAFLTYAGLQFVLTNQGGGDPSTGLGLINPETGLVWQDEETGEFLIPATHAGETVTVHHYNKMRQNYYLYLLNSEFDTDNNATEWGRNILFQVLEGDMTVSGELSLLVTEITETNQTTSIPEGHLLLTANAKSPYYDELTKFCVGDTVTLSVSTADSRLSEAVCAVGGGDVLISGGMITDPAGWDSGVASGKHPRSAIGIREDGSTVIYAVDGRRSSYSNGLTEWDLAEELIRQGCVDAINLDGGGSTTFLFREAEGDGYQVVNSPSDGSPRRCSTFLYFVMNDPGDGVAQNLYFTNRDRVVLAGAQLDYSGISAARDSGYRPVPVPGDIQISLAPESRHLGQLESGIFQVGFQPGQAVLNAWSETASGSTTATVVTEADSLTVFRSDTGAEVTSLHLDPDQTVGLMVSATANGEKALSSPSCFAFSASGSAGEIDASGVFTAGEILGSTGIVHITFGSKTVNIPVQVGEELTVLLEDFEGSSTIFTGGDDQRMYVTDGAEWVAKGSRAGVLIYDFTLDMVEDYLLPEPIQLDNAASQAALWVRGDNSGATLSILITDADGTERAVPFHRDLDFSGYELLTANLVSSGRGQVTGFRLTDTAQNMRRGVLCIDQLVLPGETGIDTEPPEIALTCGDGQLSAVLTDNSNMEFTEDMISVSVDGTQIPFTLSGNVVTAGYTLDGEGIHRLTVTASDVFGNLTRKSENPMGEVLQNPFWDVQNTFWAHPYITFLYGRGIVNGVDETHFDPDGVMTRAAFCTMLSRYLGLDTKEYEETELAFTDLPDIPDWALPHVRAMVSLGYVGGRDLGDGTVAFAPGAPITRAEIFTLLGRMSPKGYERSIRFADEEDIASWALSGVKTAVGMGVVDGYEDNTIRTGNTATRAEVAKILFFFL